MEIKVLIKKYKQHITKIINNHHDQSQILFSHPMKYCLPLQKFQMPHLQHGSTHSFIMVLGVMSMMLLVLPLCCVDARGYSYTRFVGPVAGPEHKIFVNDASSDGKTRHRGSDALRLDYVGKPEYEFAYGVEDADAHVLHNRNEMRDGDAVKGVYSLIDPDGTLRVVKYTADDINGFRAEVVRNRVPSLHGQLEHDHVPEPPPNTIKYNLDDCYSPNDKKKHHYPQSQTHLKGDKPSPNAHKPNLKQPSQNNHETPSQPHIIYYYKHHYGHDDDDSGDSNGSNESDSGYFEDNEPHYEVHEKPDCDGQENQDRRPQYKVHEKPDDDHYNKDGNAYKSSIYIKPAYKKKKQHRQADDDDFYGEDDSDELDDFDDVVQGTHNSEESIEYY